MQGIGGGEGGMYGIEARICWFGRTLTRHVHHAGVNEVRSFRLLSIHARAHASVFVAIAYDKKCYRDKFDWQSTRPTFCSVPHTFTSIQNIESRRHDQVDIADIGSTLTMRIR